jgi:hypothetical protein
VHINYLKVLALEFGILGQLCILIKSLALCGIDAGSDDEHRDDEEHAQDDGAGSDEYGRILRVGVRVWERMPLPQAVGSYQGGVRGETTNLTREDTWHTG